MKKYNLIGFWIAIGAGAGTAIGTAIYNIGVGLGIGIALGAAIGAFSSIGKKDNDLSQELTLTNSIIIGRDSTKAKLVFKNDELLSGRHCELSLKEGRIFICDLNSTNGTYVNGVPISGSFRLHNDDIILLGSMELRIGFNEED